MTSLAANRVRPLRVTRVEAVPISVPTKIPHASALGTSKRLDYGIVLVDTDAGYQGVGEISLIWHGGGASLCDAVNHVLAPALIGLDPFQLRRFFAIADAAFAFGYHSLAALAGVEMALLDIQGKVAGQPVYNLLGGLARPHVDLSKSIHMGTVEDAVSTGRAYVDGGFRTVKVKVGVDPEHDLSVIRTLRSEFSDLGIRVDANMGWRTAKQALSMSRAMARHRILSVEQPLPPNDLAGHAFLRSRLEIPVILDESVWSTRDAWQAVRAEAADMINVYASEAGGVTRGTQIIEVAALADVGAVIGSMPELGIGTSAHAHLAFAAGRLDHPCDVAGFTYADGDVVDHGLRIEDGRLYPPPGPGLGVSLDEEALERHRIDGTANWSRGAR